MFSKLVLTILEYSAIKNSSAFTESLKKGALLKVNSSKHLFKAGLISGSNQVHAKL